MKDTIIQAVLDKEYGELKSSIMQVVDKKIKEKIVDKKQSVLDKINKGE